jgi:glycine dehydrogenase
MIEPTESEDLAELDRFVDAMIAIKAEIDRVASGEWTRSTTRCGTRRTRPVMLTTQKWDRPYERELGGYPGETPHTGKYWPPVRPHRRRVRRPQPDLQLPADLRLRGRAVGRPAGG